MIIKIKKSVKVTVENNIIEDIMHSKKYKKNLILVVLIVLCFAYLNSYISVEVEQANDLIKNDNYAYTISGNAIRALYSYRMFIAIFITLTVLVIIRVLFKIQKDKKEANLTEYDINYVSTNETKNINATNVMIGILFTLSVLIIIIRNI